VNKLSHADLADAGRKAVNGTGTCQVCGRTLALRLDGTPKATHKREILHNPDAHPDHHVKSWTECHGSRLPPAEYVAAREAAKKE
jgi:hypothetical protein